jgi:hypothetical protein
VEQIFRRTSSNLSNHKERRVAIIVLPLVDTNGSVNELTFFLPRLALLQLPWIKYLVSWLEISRPITRCYHIWRNSMTLLKTSHSSDVRQEGLRVCTPQLNVNGSTTLHLPHRLLSSSMKASINKKKASTSVTNHDPRMKRIRSIVLVELPPNTTSSRRSWYLKYLLCWIWLFEGCLCVFLGWVLLPSACFWPFGLTSLKFVFPPIYFCQLGWHT